MERIKVNGQEFDLDAVVNLMDDELREKLHDKGQWASEQHFVNAYCRMHRYKFGADFSVS